MFLPWVLDSFFSQGQSSFKQPHANSLNSFKSLLKTRPFFLNLLPNHTSEVYHDNWMWNSISVTKKDPMGPFWETDPSPHISALAPVKFLNDSIWHIFEFSDAKSTTWKKLITCDHENVSPRPTGLHCTYSGLILTPVTTPCYLTINQSNCAWVDYTPWDQPLSPCMWKCFAEILWRVWGFWTWATSSPCLAP